jgi:hypothetical protein
MDTARGEPQVAVTCPAKWHILTAAAAASRKGGDGR